jgi:hypothetical protein
MKLNTSIKLVQKNATYIPLQVQVGHFVFFDTFPVVDLGRIQFLQSKLKCISIDEVNNFPKDISSSHLLYLFQFVQSSCVFGNGILYVR